MNPVLPLSLLVPLIIAVTLGAAWMAWRSSGAAPLGLRKLLLALRIIALLALALFLINPGKWRAMQDEVTRVWAVMIDRSKSMAVKDGEERRIDRAGELGTRIKASASKAGVDLRWFSYDSTLREESGQSVIEPDGDTSDLTSAADALLTQLSARGEPLAGVFVLSDGRQTHTPRHSSFGLRAQALKVPFYGVTIGGEQATTDLALRVPRKTVTAFPGQTVQITAVLESEGLDFIEVEPVLTNADGEQIDHAQLKVRPGRRTVHTFSLKAPAQSTLLTLAVPQQDGELRLANNKTDIRLRILDDKAKVFIAEGAPYWDSKFLAQLLRQQKHMDVVSVHRLSESRWFQVDSGESKPHESGIDVFPDTREELRSYDLIIFGKNSEHFLTSERIKHLREFVSDQGGAVLFSRSKPYTGLMPDLAPLEPVSWKTGITGEFKMRPSDDGQAAGLFGQALPAPDSAVWDTLPKLKDAHRIDVVKPFTRVLAYGELGGATQGRFPLLMVRRYGQGVTGLVNADGLWKWDFFPEAREMGNMYEEYWIQMIHWMLSYSEFLPGQEFSLNVSASTIDPGTPVALRMSYRGSEDPGTPVVEVTSPALAEPMRLAPAGIPTDDGRLRWGASFTPDKPGSYQLRLISETPSGETPASMPEASITVLPPPSEMDELSADQEFLREFCALSGGRLAPRDEWNAFLTNTLQPAAPESRDQGVEWHSSWMHWFTPALVLLCLGSEWWLRRRNGLV
jgi:hypothetical protein